MYGQVTKEQLHVLKQRAIKQAWQEGVIEPGVLDLCNLINSHKNMATVWSYEGHTYDEYLSRNNEQGCADDEIPGTDKRHVLFAVHGDRYLDFFKVFSQWMETLDSQEFSVSRPELQQLKLLWCFDRRASQHNPTYTLYCIEFKISTRNYEKREVTKQAWARMTEYMRDNYFHKLVHTEQTADKSSICLRLEHSTCVPAELNQRFDTVQQALNWATDNGYFISSYQE